MLCIGDLSVGDQVPGRHDCSGADVLGRRLAWGQSAPHHIHCSSEGVLTRACLDIIIEAEMVISVAL